jgi:nicotinamidase-related amidase
MQRALLVIDVQDEYFHGGLPVSHPAGSLDNILAAMDAAREQDVAVVVVRHTSPPGSGFFQVGSPQWNLLPQVAERPRDLLLDKNLPGSFTGTSLEDWLRQRGINEIAICGYMTQMCCDTTSRQAFHRGFAVQFLSDATGTLDIKNDAGSVSAEELHRAILVTQAMRFAKVLSTAQWVQEISSTP